MSVYRGHAWLVVAILFALVGTMAGYGYFLRLAEYDNLGTFLLLIVAAVSWIIALVSVAIAYTNWVPKWERTEKRTGHIPGEKENK